MVTTQPNNFNDSKVFRDGGSKVMDDSRFFKHNDSKVGDTSRFEAASQLKQSMAHGLSRLINFDEET